MLCLRNGKHRKTLNSSLLWWAANTRIRASRRIYSTGIRSSLCWSCRADITCVSLYCFIRAVLRYKRFDSIPPRLRASVRSIHVQLIRRVLGRWSRFKLRSWSTNCVDMKESAGCVCSFGARSENLWCFVTGRREDNRALRWKKRLWSCVQAIKNYFILVTKYRKSGKISSVVLQNLS